LPPVLDSSPVVSLSLSLLSGERGDGKKESEGDSVFLPFPFPSPLAPVARVTRRQLETSQPLSSLNRYLVICSFA